MSDRVKTENIIEKKEKVKYMLYSEGTAPTIHEATVDYLRIRDQVLLNLYYAEILKLKESAYDVLNLLNNLIWWECSVFISPVVRSHLMTISSESMRFMAKMYCEKLIDTCEDTNGTCIVTLCEEGKTICEKLLKNDSEDKQ